MKGGGLLWDYIRSRPSAPARRNKNPTPMVPAVTSNTPATGSSVGVGVSRVTTLPAASISTLQLSLWPLVDVTSAVLATDVVPVTLTLARNDL